MPCLISVFIDNSLQRCFRIC